MPDAKKKRTCKTDNRALYGASGLTLEFVFMRKRSGHSGLDKHLRPSSRRMAAQQETETVRTVKETVSLADLLKEHAAPRIVHYMCLDVEGAERPIMEAFPFDGPHNILAVS